jgi:hypothetical protein
LPSDLVLHGLRHSVGTVAVLAGLSGFEVKGFCAIGIQQRHRDTFT